MHFKRNLSSCMKLANKLKAHFYLLYCSFLFQNWKKAMNTYMFLLHMFLLLQETS